MLLITYYIILSLFKFLFLEDMITFVTLHRLEFRRIMKFFAKHLIMKLKLHWRHKCIFSSHRHVILSSCANIEGSKYLLHVCFHSDIIGITSDGVL